MTCRIRMRTLCAGPEGVFRPGSEREVTRQEAEMLVEGGYAEYVVKGEHGNSIAEETIETTATMPTVEHAVRRKGRTAERR